MTLSPGTTCIVHAKSEKRASWAYHNEDGWYVDPAVNHYRRFKCYTPATHKVKISDTVQIIPHTFPIPSVSLKDHIVTTAENLVITL